MWNKASKARHATFSHLRGVTLPPLELDQKLEDALEAVELEYLLARCSHQPSENRVLKQHPWFLSPHNDVSLWKRLLPLIFGDPKSPKRTPL